MKVSERPKYQESQNDSFVIVFVCFLQSVYATGEQQLEQGR